MADEKKLTDKELEAKKLADEKAKNEAIEAKKLAKEKAADEAKKLAKDPTTYIMKVVHLSWGLNKKNHFYSPKKPTISRVAMNKYHGDIDTWLKAGWIEKGKYKKSK